MGVPGSRGGGSGARAVRPLRPLPAWVALLVSLAVHAQIFGLAFFFGGGMPHAGGERGLAGAGGATLEITVQGADRDAPPRPSVEVSPPRPPAPEPEAQVQRDAEVEPEARAARRTLASRDRRAAHAVPDGVAPEAGSPEREERAAPEPAPALRAGDDRERTGRARGDDVAAVILGSVGLGSGAEGSRALLERALECSDPIAGVWIAHRYSPQRRDWGRMTLRIRREGDELRGTITSHIWSGLPSDRRPLPCAPGRFDVTVRMPARGRIDGERFSFGSSSYEVTRIDCSSPGFLYYPDSFRGTVDSVRDELDALNDDGHVEIDAPYRFRRTACTPD